MKIIENVFKIGKSFIKKSKNIPKRGENTPVFSYHLKNLKTGYAFALCLIFKLLLCINLLTFFPNSKGTLH